MSLQIRAQLCFENYRFSCFGGDPERLNLASEQLRSWDPSVNHQQAIAIIQNTSAVHLEHRFSRRDTHSPDPDDDFGLHSRLRSSRVACGVASAMPPIE